MSSSCSSEGKAGTESDESWITVLSALTRYERNCAPIGVEVVSLAHDRYLAATARDAPAAAASWRTIALRLVYDGGANITHVDKLFDFSKDEMTLIVARMSDELSARRAAYTG